MKVGDYVRTKKYGIKKILDIGEYLGITQYLIDEDGTYIIDNSIIKSSPNIIDLVEEGDYVNGSYIYSVVEENKNTGQPRVLFTEEDGVLGAGDIKSIVTKEMYSSVEYRVENN